MNEAKTIDEVLDQLDEIIEETLHDNSYACVFAYVYRRTTAQIKEAILQGRFDDNERMEKMDVVFANYYIRAFYDYKNKLSVCNAWKTAFDNQHQPVTLIQHLLLGMNAHINYDLGQAAAKVAQGSQIKEVERDFMTVNLVLAELVDEMQLKLGGLSPLMILLDWAGKRSDELIVNFSMVKAREYAWRLANELAVLKSEAEIKDRIAMTDSNVSALCSIVVRPPGRVLKYIMQIIGLFEEKDVKKIIRKLSDDK